MHRAQAASDGIDDADLAYHEDELTRTYAFSKATRARKDPGPATYSPSKSYTLPRGPRATIGREERFSSSYAGCFFRAEAASELQCRDSPGPKYAPRLGSTMPRAPTANWGPKPSPDEVQRKFFDWAQRDGATAGPAAYNPKHETTLRSGPRVRFGKADRFSSFGNQYALNNSPHTSDGPNEALISLDAVRPKSAAFSFGGGRLHPPRPTDHEARSRPRTAFLTHSIRGGLARPATLECNIGPADYSVDQHSIARNVKQPRPGRSGFGTAPRFARPGLVFVSAEHAKADGTVCSPGPKYAYSQGSVSVKARQSTSLSWVP